MFQQDSEIKLTFDTLTEKLKLFDTEDKQNWRILGQTVMILASDILLFLMQKVSPSVNINQTLIDSLFEMCKYYACDRYKELTEFEDLT